MSKKILLIILLSLCCNSATFSQKKGNAYNVKTKESALTENNQTENRKLFDEANKEKLLGNIDKAENMFREIIEKFPQDDASYYELAKIMNDKYMISDALSYIEEAIKYDSKNKWYLELYAQILSANGQYKKAIDAWETLSRKYPDNFEYYNELAIAYVENKKFNDAVKVYNSVEKKFGVSEEISTKKYKIWLAVGDTKKAVKELKNLIAAFPFQTKYRLVLAELFINTKNDDLALEQYNKVAEINPEDEYIHITLSDFYRKAGNKEKSWSELKKGFANPNLSVETKINVIRSFNETGTSNSEIAHQLNDLIKILANTHPDNPYILNLYSDMLSEEGKMAEATEMLRKSVQIDSLNYQSWQRLMFIDWDNDNRIDAVKAAEKLMTLLPTYPISYLITGMYLSMDEKWQQALDYLEKGVKFVIHDDKLFLQFYMLMGDCYHQVGNDDKAFECYDKCLKIEPNNAYVLNNYAYFLATLGVNMEKAELMAQKAVQYDPENSAALDTYGWILFKLNKFSDAEQYLRKAVENDTNNSSEVLEHLGDILFKLNKIEEAVSFWEKAKIASGKNSGLLEKKIKDKKLYE